MSFAGAVFAMISSLKNNSRPRKSHNGRPDNNHVHNRTPIRKADISEEELEKIKKEIRQKLSRKNRQARFLSASILILLIGLFAWAYFWLSN